jgi:dihydropyrimidinase
MAPFDLRIRDARVVTPEGIFPGNLYCRDGKIEAITSVATVHSADRDVDAGGRYLLPGLIEPHVHLGPFNGLESDMETETRSALAGGITTIMNFVTTKSSLREEIARQQKVTGERSYCDVGLMGVVMNQRNIDELESCFELGVVSYKHYMSKPEFEKFLGWSYPDEGQILESFAKISKLGGMAMVHPENYEIIARKIEQVRSLGRGGLEAWEEARPWYCEYDHMMTAVLLASIANVSLYVVHVSIGSFEEIARFAKSRSVTLYMETNPAYLYFTKKDPEIGILGKVNPPIRGEDEREALWAGLKSGEINCVGSDHIACNKKTRMGGGDIWTAVPGLHGLEMMLPIMLSEGFHKRGLCLEKIAAVTSTNTATIHRLPNKGRVSIGYDADFCLIDLDREVRVSQEIMHDSSDYTLFEGRTFRGWPYMTVSSGEVVMEDSVILAKPGRGRPIYCRGEKESTPPVNL